MILMLIVFVFVVVVVVVKYGVFWIDPVSQFVPYTGVVIIRVVLVIINTSS